MSRSSPCEYSSDTQSTVHSSVGHGQIYAESHWIDLSIKWLFFLPSDPSLEAGRTRWQSDYSLY